MARANIVYTPTPLLRPLQISADFETALFEGLFLFILLKKYEDGLNNDSYSKDYFGAKTITKVRPSNFGLCSITAISSVFSTI